MGQYDLGPDAMARMLGEFAERGWVNIVGGCCGTTPDHIRAIADAVRSVKPHKQDDGRAVHAAQRHAALHAAARQQLPDDRRADQCHRLAEVRPAHQETRSTKRPSKSPAQQVEGGANVIDVNMDEALLDGEAVMTKFLRLIAGEPEVAAVPVMVDSCKWSVIEAGLKSRARQSDRQLDQPQGWRSRVPAPRHALPLVRRGGRRDGVRRARARPSRSTDKVRICRRAYELLTEKVGFPPEDIIFDPNILTVATGIEEHNNYAVNFIEAIAKIKEACPGAHISGGVSNISFSFRGNDVVREAMHAAFLYHAIRAGLDMGIVNAGQLAVYEEIEPKLKERVEDVLLNRRPDATERLVEFAETVKGQGGPPPKPKKPGATRRSKSGSSTRSSKASSSSSMRTPKKPAQKYPLAASRSSKAR